VRHERQGSGALPSGQRHEEFDPLLRGWARLHIKFRWEVEGQPHKCWLALGGASLILQQFATEGHDSWRLERQLGLGGALCFVCEDAIAIFRGARARGLEATEPQVGNAMWVNVDDRS